MIKAIHFFAVIICLNMQIAQAQKSAAWSPDNGDGTYTNPVLHADYSDPDAIRAGDNFYMIASSFNMVPGLPILQSTDLVNWKLVGHALKQNVPVDHFQTVRHGGGVWAPAIRFRNNEFYIYYPDPDFGIYLIKAKNIEGPWSEPLLVLPGKGLIDPCPLWETDGKAYLVHAYAGSRAGMKSIIVVKQMSADGTRVSPEGVMVFDGHLQDETVEGPKFYKRNNYYYIFAPAGGVSTGWQLVLRSKNIYGPYESKTVLHQGNAKINGPHQGAWITAPDGKDWFLHFQDKEAYGRVVHLQPMKWQNDWPVMGQDVDGDGNGEPVVRHQKPVSSRLMVTPPDTDEFNTAAFGKQWQWPANQGQQFVFPTASGYLRMFSAYKPDTLSLWHFTNKYLQKMPAETFTVTTKFLFNPYHVGETAGLLIDGLDYAYIGIRKTDKGNEIFYATCKNVEKNSIETRSDLGAISSKEIYLRMTVADSASCRFSFSENGRDFKNVPASFVAKPGKWIGATMGLFMKRDHITNNAGFIDVDWFRVEK